MLQAEISDFMRRNHLKRNEVAMICHKNGRMYLQWAGVIPRGMPSQTL